MDLVHKQAFMQLFDLIYKGDRTAARLSFDILRAVHLWDDLIDKDKEISDSEIHRVFISLFCDVAVNPLWDSFMASNFMNVYYRWRDANVIEADKNSTENEIAKAWMLRAGCYDLFVLLASKLHGHDWAIEIGPTVRAFYGEPLEQFIKETQDA